MAENNASPTIISQIDTTESNLNKCQKRVEFLEESLRKRNFSTDDEKTNAKNELDDVKQNLAQHGCQLFVPGVVHKLCDEKELKKLRGENRRSMVMAVVLLLAIYVAYNFIMFAIKKSSQFGSQ